MIKNPDLAFFQLAYVCSDLDSALRTLCEKPSEAFLTIDVAALGAAADAPVKRLALGYLGNTNIELIEVRSDVESIFTHALREDRGPGFHHIGYLVDGEDNWQRLIDQIGGAHAAADIGHTDGFLSYLYLDRREALGHFVEYVKLEDGGRQLFANVPRGMLEPLK
jgi:hypothetical protein